MTTYNWPVGNLALTPQALRWKQIHNNRATVSPLSGYTQTTSVPGMRWGVVMDFPAQTVRERRELEGWLTRLSGMEHRAAIYDIARQSPRGAAQLAGVTLGAAPAQFATSINLAGLVAAPNLIANSSFEIDTNADGLADGWLAYSAGSTGAITRSRSTSSPAHSANYQQVQAAALGATSSDHAGIYRNVAVSPALPYTLSASLQVETGAFESLLYQTFRDGSNTIITGGGSVVAATGSWARFAYTATAPVNAASVDIFAFMRAGGGALCRMGVDAVQFEQAAAASAWAGFPTLLAGDWLGMSNGQLVQVVADVSASDAGAGSFEIRPPLRAALANGAPVTLSRPTALFVLAEPQLEVPYGAANICPPFSVEFVEVFA